MWRLWMSQSCFFIGFLSQYSLWKISIFRGYEAYLYLCVFGMWKVSFSKTKLAGGLASRLDWAASWSHELIEWPVWNFCPVVLQQAWHFSFSACLARMQLLAACKLRVTHEIQMWVPFTLQKLEHFFILSHTLPLHDSHLNIELLIAKLQANLAWNKANKMID